MKESALKEVREGYNRIKKEKKPSYLIKTNY